MRIIKFRRLKKLYWEIAFNKKHLRMKLNGDMAEIIMPAKPLLIRIWRRFFPIKETKEPKRKLTYNSRK